MDTCLCGGVFLRACQDENKADANTQRNQGKDVKWEKKPTTEAINLNPNNQSDSIILFDFDDNFQEIDTSMQQKKEMY